jgi:hypothetical protein
MIEAVEFQEAVGDHLVDATDMMPIRLEHGARVLTGPTPIAQKQQSANHKQDRAQHQQPVSHQKSVALWRTRLSQTKRISLCSLRSSRSPTKH